MWQAYLKGFKAYLQLERSLSDNSVEAYLHDVEKLIQYLAAREWTGSPGELDLIELRKFIQWIARLGMTAASQARIISGLKGFYKYLLLEDIIKTDPTQLLEGPKLQRKLPDILSVEEIKQIISAIDLSKPEGGRNRAIIETMYSSGLRVSEAANLKISCLHLDIGFIRVTGKGNKERLVPIGEDAIKQIKIYKENIRVHIPVKKNLEDILFLNRRGG